MKVKIYHHDNPGRLLQMLKDKFETPLVNFKEEGENEIIVEIDEDELPFRSSLARQNLLEEIKESSEWIFKIEVIG